MKRQYKRSTLTVILKLLSLVGSFSLIILLAVINGILGFLASMSVTILGSIGLAKILGTEIPLSLIAIIAMIISFGFLRGFLRYFEQYSNHYIAFRLLAIIRDKVFSALRVLAPAKLETKKKGSIIAMISSDVETLEVFYAHTISPICIAVSVSVLTFLFIGFVSSWYLALVALFAYLVIGILLPIYGMKLLKIDGEIYRNEFSNFSSYFLDSIKGLKEIIFNNQKKERMEVIENKSDKLLTQTKKIKKNSARITALTEMIVSLISIITLAVGIVLVTYQDLDIGLMIIGFVSLISSFGPVIAISNLPSNLTQTFASGNRILDLMDEKPVVREITGKKDIEIKNVETKDLSFSYSEENVVLDKVNFSVNPHEIVAVIGKSGSGKSTLLKLLLRFFERDSGEINYNGVSINEINTKNLLNNVTLVSQETYLYDLSIKDNIKIAKPDATDEEVYEAAKKAAIHDFIMTLKDGYDTNVSSFIENISAGEKQRIGLARAFLSSANIVLLDEVTSNVDAINEGIILKSILDQKKEKTFVIVSHRESTIQIADRIFTFN